MENSTNICGDSIDYDLAAGSRASEQELYRDAMAQAEDSLALIAKIQEDRRNYQGTICEPLTRTEIKSLIEYWQMYLGHALSVLQALEKQR
ncbi:hypothetical protein [Haloarcula salinisoli]|uniref:Uncharacterized protein n=1 Tax=Haloarcula salinisoli TaxID=2487746 RepID=A0A8J8C7U2_9EURY|nr:hypothetical protein [Halomicroarcula salinisoli]MBX0303716.1 hypothetical protein [Halomicroarcula salinisoli]